MENSNNNSQLVNSLLAALAEALMPLVAQKLKDSAQDYPTTAEVGRMIDSKTQQLTANLDSELTRRLENAEEQIATLDGKCDDLDSAMEDKLNTDDVDEAVRDAVDNLNFKIIVS